MRKMGFLGAEIGFADSRVPERIGGRVTENHVQNDPEFLFLELAGMCTPGHFWNKKTARCLATRGRWNFRETLLGFFERGLGGGEAGYWHAER
jgi:hypothetical protein